VLVVSLSTTQHRNDHAKYKYLILNNIYVEGAPKAHFWDLRQRKIPLLKQPAHRPRGAHQTVY
tara:strand:+ start:584 stop:772 length:189 start_codon:yes stop_codon:yes gene_type:complete